MVKKSLSEQFPAIMRSIRLGLGLSQEQLADKADLHRNHIGMIERGERSPTLRALEGIAIGLGIKLSELMARAEKRI